MGSQSEQGLLTTREAANWLNVSRHTVLIWVKEGRLPALRLQRGHLRYRIEDVKALLKPVGIETDE